MWEEILWFIFCTSRTSSSEELIFYLYLQIINISNIYYRLLSLNDSLSLKKSLFFYNFLEILVSDNLVNSINLNLCYFLVSNLIVNCYILFVVLIELVELYWNLSSRCMRQSVTILSVSPWRYWDRIWVYKTPYIIFIYLSSAVQR